MLDGRWYLVSDSIVEGYENQVFPVRVNPETKELEFPFIDNEVQFYIVERQGWNCIITDIVTEEGSKIDYSELTNVGRVIGADGTSQTDDTPSNVVGFFEL